MDFKKSLLVFTYGAPPPLVIETAEKYNKVFKENTFRFVHANDPVPGILLNWNEMDSVFKQVPKWWIVNILEKIM